MYNDNKFQKIMETFQELQDLHAESEKIMKRMLFSAVISAVIGAVCFGYAIGFAVGYMMADQSNPRHDSLQVVESKRE